MQFYKQIEATMEANMPLTDSITDMYTSLMPNRKFKPIGLSEQQSLALVYEHLRAPLKKLQNRIESEIKYDECLEEGEENEEEVNDLESEEGNLESGDYENENENEGEGYEQEEEDENNEEQEQEEANEMDNQDMDGEYENEEEDEEGEESLGNVPSEMVSEEDIGLYGEEIDEEDSMESYENENMGDDPEFGNFKLNKKEFKSKKGKDEDEHIEDNFDQFRQIEMENQAKKQEEEPNEIEKQIEKLESRAMQNKNWVLGGEIKAKERPVNSLLGTELEFKSGIKYSHEINETYNKGLEGIIQQRILDEIFDDRTRFIPNAGFAKRKLEHISTEKSNKGLAELYEIEFKDSLGLGDGKNEKLKKEIMDSFKEVNYFLDSLSNTGFALKPNLSLHRNGVEAIVLEDKVPVTNWNGSTEGTHMKHTFESEKEVNNKTKRLRNKRNARQRKKEVDRKKMNRSIEYGGITKFEAEARKKITKTKMSSSNVKYSKSNSFFSNINNKSAKAGKPNPNLSKLKV